MGSATPLKLTRRPPSESGGREPGKASPGRAAWSGPRQRRGRRSNARNRSRDRTRTGMGQRIENAAPRSRDGAQFFSHGPRRRFERDPGGEGGAGVLAGALQSEREEETRDRAERGSVVGGSDQASVAPKRTPTPTDRAMDSRSNRLRAENEEGSLTRPSWLTAVVDSAASAWGVAGIRSRSPPRAKGAKSRS
jgi:hypothetical protein